MLDHHHPVLITRRFSEDNREVFFLAALPGCVQDHQWHQRAWFGLMKSPYVLPPQPLALTLCCDTRFDSMCQDFSLNRNEVERSECREHARLCCGHWSKSVNQDHQPVSPPSWERLKLHRSHVGLFWAATESSRGQATGSGLVCPRYRRTPSCPTTSALFSALLHFVTLTGSWRMLCATSPGECVDAPTASGCSLDVCVERWEATVRQTLASSL